MNAPHDQARMLLRKATEDLIVGELAFDDGRALTLACYHAQQAAEKSLKALLALEDVKYPWTHNLRTLSELLCDLFPELEPAMERTVPLTRFATQARYMEGAEPDLEEATEALESAREIHRLAAAVVDKRLGGESDGEEAGS